MEGAPGDQGFSESMKGQLFYFAECVVMVPLSGE